MRTEHTVKSFDGTELYYTVEGTGELDLLLCDGIGCDGFIWRYMRPSLLKRGRVIHLHMRGHGRSAIPKDPTAIEMYHLARDWRVVLDEIDSTHAVALGHSMGVQVALELWHLDPKRIGGLVLTCGSYEDPTSTFHDADMLKRVLPVLLRLTRLGGDRLQKIWGKTVAMPLGFHIAKITELHPDFARWHDFGPYLKHLARMDPRIFFAMAAAAGRHSARAFLRDIDVPVLVVAGSHDRFTPGRLSETMANRIEYARLLMVEDGTHTAPLEFPTLTNLAVSDFLDGAFK